MEKEKLLSELKGKLGTTSLSDRTIDEYATRILPTIVSDEMVNDSFWDVHTSILKTFEGNLNHVVASKVNELKAEWEKKNVKTPPPPQKEEPHEDGKYETLLKEIEALKKANEDSLKKSAVESLKVQITAKGSDLNVTNKNLWKDCVQSYVIPEGQSEDDIVTAVKKDYESRLKSYIGDGAIPYGGAVALQRVSEEKANAKREAFKERMRSQGKLPK